jgi:hypothetical protein
MKSRSVSQSVSPSVRQSSPVYFTLSQQFHFISFHTCIHTIRPKSLRSQVAIVRKPIDVQRLGHCRFKDRHRGREQNDREAEDGPTAPTECPGAVWAWRVVILLRARPAPAGRIWKIGTAVGSSLWRRCRRLGTRRGIFLEIEAVGTVGGCFVSQEECFQVGPGE